MLGSCEGSIAGMTGAMASCVDSSFITPPEQYIGYYSFSDVSLDIGHLSQFGGDSCTECVEIICNQCSQCYLCCRLKMVSCVLSCLLRHAFAHGWWVGEGSLWLPLLIHGSSLCRCTFRCATL